jgi:hypothetical protein
MRILLALVFLVSSPAFAQRVKENIKQVTPQPGPRSQSNDFETTPVNPKPATETTKETPKK